MTIRVPEKNKKPGVYYAVSDDGVELPVVDITHPSFALHPTPADMEALREHGIREHARWERRPDWMRRALFFLARRRSVLLQGLNAGGDSFLSGMNTYLMKLGPDNLGEAYIKPLDRHVAGDAQAVNVRLRLAHTARLVAGGLSSLLDREPAGPVRLVNIAGGPAMDSINALILLRKHSPGRIVGRAVLITVLDGDAAGPRFGERALAALRSPDGPLAGLNVRLERLPYDWNDFTRLGGLLGGLEGASAGSSEGGLFEYGSDGAILENLCVLRERTPPGFTVSGSYSLDIPVSRASIRLTRLSRRLFTHDQFDGLVQRAGWRVDETLEGTTTVCFRLAKS